MEQIRKRKIDILRKTAAIGAVILLLFLIYLGSYLPFRKASLFIQTLRSFNTVKSLEDLEKRLDRLFDFYSPVGDEEVLRFLTTEFVKVMQGNLPQPLAAFLVGYTENRYLEYVSSRVNVNVVKLIVQLAQLRTVYGLKYQDSQSLAAAEKYYKEGLKLSPRRPEYLFGLYDLYRTVGRLQEAAELGKEILIYWPALRSNL